MKKSKFTLRVNPVWDIKYQKFLKRLKQARLEANLTQVEISKELQKPQSYISKCESGERRIDIAELVYFAELYKKPVDFFIQDFYKKK